MAQVDSAAFRAAGCEYGYVVIDELTEEPISGLTPAETEVARLVCLGCTNHEIAKRRGTRENTVANQLAAIFDKLSVSSRYQLVERVTTLQHRAATRVK